MTMRLFAVLFLGLAVASPATAQSVEQFYKGRTVTLIVGFAPGGINDIAGRLVGRHLGRFIPGAPTVVVQNLPGAGGLVTANRLSNVAERDGSVIAGLGRAVPQLAIQGYPNANFDPLKFTWLGSLSSYADDAYLMLVNARHPAQKRRRPGQAPPFDQARHRPGRREQSRLLAHRQGGVEPQCRSRARLFRRRADFPRDAQRRARWPDDRVELGRNPASAICGIARRSARWSSSAAPPALPSSPTCPPDASSPAIPARSL